MGISNINVKRSNLFIYSNNFLYFFQLIFQSLFYNLSVLEPASDNESLIEDSSGAEENSQQSQQPQQGAGGGEGNNGTTLKRVPHVSSRDALRRYV